MRKFWYKLVFLVPLVGCDTIAYELEYLSYLKLVEYVSDTSDFVPEFRDHNTTEPDFSDDLADHNFTSFLWLRNDDLIYEWYQNAEGKTEPVNVKSVSKSMISMLVGALENDGFVSADAPISSFDNCPVPPDLAPLSLRTLLNMSAGYKFYENYTVGIYGQPNWACSTLTLPIEAPSGKRYNYNTLQYYLAGVHLEEITGQSMPTLLQHHLFGPMGVKLDGWVISPDGHMFSGSELWLQPRDMLRFGQVMLNGGVWENTQIVPPKWIARAKQPVFDTSRAPKATYGWGWWQRQIGPYDAYLAEGFGMQSIIIIPKARSVFVFTAPTEFRGDTPDQRLQTMLSITEKLLLQNRR